MKKLKDIINSLNLKKMYYEDSLLSSNFIDKMTTLINANSPFYYPEKKNEYVFPLNEKPFLVDTSTIRNYRRARYILKKFKNHFNVSNCEATYNNLADEFSKEKFLMFILYKVYHEVKIRFPQYYANYFNNLNKYDELLISDEEIKINSDILNKYDLSALGYNLKLICPKLSLITSFIANNYTYRDDIFVKKGDYIIDGGAHYGESSLYFANLCGETGKVFSFEFFEENVDIMYKNIKLNEQYRDVIDIIKRPLFGNSNTIINILQQNIEPRIFYTDEYNAKNSITTISIDDFISKNEIEKIDFIKLDLDGRELSALRGAENTIKKFTPKLAICIHNKLEDLWTIPEYLKELIPEYNLYIDHHMINHEGLVLYAKMN